MVIDWFYWTRMGQLDINPVEFPDPTAMNKALHDAGMRSIVSVWPRFERESRYFDWLASRRAGCSKMLTASPWMAWQCAATAPAR
jgi:alpha-D-xyloside xylohydrolase